MRFLENSNSDNIPLDLNVSGLSATRLFLGKGRLALEIAVFSALTKPNSGTLQRAYKKQRDGRATPVLIVATHPDGVALCGTTDDKPPIYHVDEIGFVERLCTSALEKPDRNVAIRFLADVMPSLETELPGISNEGLLSSHELKHGTRNRKDWSDAVIKSKSVLKKSGQDIISALGFTSKRLDNLTDLLLAGEERTALAVLLNEDEIPEISSNRFNDVSPVSYALTKADKENLSWVVMIQKNRGGYAYITLRI